MPCNAWNHAPSCDCGWGGVGYGGQRTPSFDPTWVGNELRIPNIPGSPTDLWSTHVRNEESFMTPNAHCPVCGDEVFFYRSPYGGAVYFDDVPWPWPKHPCTDKQTGRRLSIGSSFIPRKTKGAKPRTVGDGWAPVKFMAAQRYPNYGKRGDLLIYRVDRLGRGQSLSLVLDGHVPLDPRVPMFLREKHGSAGAFELTTIGTGETSHLGEAIQLDCVTAAFAAIGYPSAALLQRLKSGELSPEQACELAWSVSFNVARAANAAITPNWEVGRALFERAARAGCDDAFRGLAWIYWGGHGGPRDVRRAKAFFRRAAKNGEPRAVEDLQQFEAAEGN